MPPTSDDEARIVTGASVFSEYCAAFGLATNDPPARLAAVAQFADLDPALGWAGNLRRRHGTRTAVRRGDHAWTFDQLATDGAAWRTAAGPCASGRYATLVEIVADHLLCADTRPDDTLVWTGDPADPWPWGALILGAGIAFRR